jgi:hypothetical protein
MQMLLNWLKDLADKKKKHVSKWVTAHSETLLFNTLVVMLPILTFNKSLSFFIVNACIKLRFLQLFGPKELL